MRWPRMQRSFRSETSPDRRLRMTPSTRMRSRVLGARHGGGGLAPSAVKRVTCSARAVVGSSLTLSASEHMSLGVDHGVEVCLPHVYVLSVAHLHEKRRRAVVHLWQIPALHADREGVPALLVLLLTLEYTRDP